MKSFVFFLMVLFTVSPLSANDQAAPALDYDRAADTLTLAETRLSLQSLLRQISVLSGIEVRLDPAEERQVLVSFERQPVPQALDSLARQYRLNTIKQYSRDEAGVDQLSGFFVLREGEMSAAGLPPLVDLTMEAMNQSRKAARQGQAHTTVRAYQRWQARFAELPPRMRADIQARFEERLAKEAAREAERAEKDARKKEKRQAREAEQAAKRESLKASNPKAYERALEQEARVKALAAEETKRRREAALSEAQQ